MSPSYLDNKNSLYQHRSENTVSELRLNDKLNFILLQTVSIIHHIKTVVVSVQHDLGNFPHLNRSIQSIYRKVM
jgi:hypothetical protein